MSLHRLVILLIFSLMLLPETQAGDFNYKGYIDTYQSIAFKAPYDLTGSRTRLRLEGEFSLGDAWAFASLNAVYNGIVRQETGISLREAYAGYAGDYFDFKAGNQIIIWGQSEGLYVTDNVSPKDYSEALARDFDDMRMPVTALRGRLLLDKLTCEVVFLPLFTPATVPFRQYGVAGEWDSNPWALELPAGIPVYKTTLPETRAGNSEVGVKLSLSTSALDCAISYLYTWNDIPTFFPASDGIHPRHDRLNIAGIDISLPVRVFVIHGEAAFTRGNYFKTTSGKPSEKDNLTGLAGIDISPGNEWSISAQIYDQFILDWQSGISDPRHDVYATLRLSKDLLRNTLSLSAMLFYGVEHNEIYLRSSGAYAITDAFKISAGVDIFEGDKNGSLGMYSNNSGVFAEFRYSF